MKIVTIKKGFLRLSLLSFMIIVQSVVWAQSLPTESTNSVQNTLTPGRNVIKTEVFFPIGKGSLNLNYKGNKENLKRFLNELNRIVMDTTYVVNRVMVTGSSSPEGNVARNKQLANMRATSLYDYIIKNGSIPKEKVEIINLGENWIKLKELVETSDMPRKDRILSIMDRHSDDYATLKNAIIRDANGKSWDWMFDHLFPQLRNGTGGTCDITLTYATKAVVAKETPTANPTIIIEDTVAVVNNVDTTPIIVVSNDATTDTIIRKPLFALKTNLLYDVATILNLELEVPIGNRWSVAGELIFPWWLSESKQNCIQVISGTLEGRYWFGNRISTSSGKPRNVMTGWFAGVHVGGGYYDLEHKGTGYQGEFFIAAGISGGFAHSINKRGNLRMEYSIGIGYLSTNYRMYEAEFSTSDNAWHLYRERNGQFSWFGPTRVKVSLVWLLDSGLFKKKGGRR